MTTRNSTPTPTPTPTPLPPLRDPAEGKPPAVIDPHAPAPKTAPEPPAETVADEQRKRSAEIEAAGVEQWKEEHDDRSEGKGKQAQVEGVKPLIEHEHASGHKS